MDNFWKWMKVEKGILELKNRMELIGYLEEYGLVKLGTFWGSDSNIFTKLREGKRYEDIRYEQMVKEIKQREEK